MDMDWTSLWPPPSAVRASIYLHDIMSNVVACWISMYLHTEWSCTHKIVVIYLHDVMDPHVMLHVIIEINDLSEHSVNQLLVKENWKLTIFPKNVISMLTSMQIHTHVHVDAPTVQWPWTCRVMLYSNPIRLGWQDMTGISNSDPSLSPQPMVTVQWSFLAKSSHCMKDGLYKYFYSGLYIS